jgi:RNA polymerase sigma-70 factor, ECF subfamily
MLRVHNDAGARRTARPPGQLVSRAPTPPDDPSHRGDVEDDAALAALAGGDPDAFGQLYDRYCDQVYRFTTRRLRDRQAAEDVTAEVFFKALRAIDSYRPAIAPFSAWLFRIATNAVTDHLRARRPSNSLDAVADTPDATTPVDEQVINRVEADRVWLAVGALSGAQRMAVVLRLGHDLPIAEIASRMERSEGAVKLLLNRGLSTVRSLLAGRDGVARPGSGAEPGPGSGPESGSGARPGPGSGRHAHAERPAPARRGAR